MGTNSYNSNAANGLPVPATNTAAVILAAGYGKRSGGPKALRLYRRYTFIEHILSKLQSLCPVVAVVNPIVQSYLQQLKIPLKTCLNHDPLSDMSYSLHLGLSSLPNYRNYLVYPVDHPLVSYHTLTALLKQAINLPAQAYVVPSYNGQNGHPVLVPARVATVLKQNPGKPLNKALYGFERHLLPVDDPGVLANLNYPGAIK